jgi:predicted nucleic acid-binding protein
MPSLVGLDSNILIYTELEPKSDKGLQARAIIEWVSDVGVAPVQVLLEFMTVVRKRKPERVDAAIRKAAVWASVFRAPATTTDTMEMALQIVLQHQLQVWDAVILAAAREAGARVLLSEDMHDGGVYGGVEIVNPFATDLEGLKARLSRA